VRAVLAAAALAVLLLGCGGGEEDLGAPVASEARVREVDRREWAQDLHERCEDLNDEYAALATADPQDRAAAVAHAEQVEAFAVDLVAALEAAGAPDADRRAAQELERRVDQLRAAAAELAEGAADGDVEGTAAAAARLDELGEVLNDLAEDLDVSACGGF
jgi:hypothetical protein